MQKLKNTLEKVSCVDLKNGSKSSHAFDLK